tara:strand:- start:1124 stop:1504 length:381 start_codon:yes stop_codon:yes gene_type:complete
MKISYEQLYRSYPTFKHLLKEPLPIQTTLKIKTFLEEVNPHLQQIEHIQTDLLRKYTKETSEGVFEMTNENKKEFIAELQTSLTPEITVEWNTIKISDLGSTIKISAAGLKDISYLLEDYEVEAVF